MADLFTKEHPHWATGRAGAVWLPTTLHQPEVKLPI